MGLRSEFVSSTVIATLLTLACFCFFECLLCILLHSFVNTFLY